VTTIDSATTTRRRSAVKIVGALSAVGAAVAVAGMGTFGNFTDSTSPVGTKVDTGVLSIDVSQPGGAAVPFSGGMMLAGDSRSAVIDLVNDGNTALSAITIKSWATSSSILDQDTVNGLQLTVESCSVAWNTAGASPTCPGTVRSYFTQPIIVNNYPLNFSAATAAGATDHLKLTAALPNSASGDAFEGASSDLKFQFTGIQRGGGVR
jgi:predicted ribosomally synthesized peptide with SipW-like signal peptide